MRELQHYHYVQEVVNMWNKLLGKATEEKNTNDRRSHLAFLEGEGVAEYEGNS